MRWSEGNLEGHGSRTLSRNVVRRFLRGGNVAINLGDRRRLVPNNYPALEDLRDNLIREERARKLEILISDARVKERMMKAFVIGGPFLTTALTISVEATSPGSWRAVSVEAIPTWGSFSMVVIAGAATVYRFLKGQTSEAYLQQLDNIKPRVST